MSDNKAIIVESRTILSRWSTRNEIGAARIQLSANEHLRFDGQLGAGESDVHGSVLPISKFLQITVEQPLEVTLTIDEVSNNSLKLTVDQHLTITAEFLSVTIRNPSTDPLEVIGYRLICA